MNTATFTTLASSLRVLNVGGAEPIGSHRVMRPLRRGCDVVAFDNLPTDRLDSIFDGSLRLRDPADRLVPFSTLAQDATFQFASYIQIGESVKEPASYHIEKVAHTLDEMRGAVIRD